MTETAHAAEVVRFVLLMPWGRVGSNLVANALGDVEGVEVLNEPTTVIRTKGHRARRPVADISREQFAHLEAFTSRSDPSIIAAGLKLSHRSLVDHVAYLQKLNALNYKLVLLRRSNHLKTAVSQIRALQRVSGDAAPKGTWRSPWAIAVEEDKPGPTAIDVDETVRLTKLFAKLDANMMKSVTASYGDDHLSLEYDDLRQNPQTSIKAVFAYLALPTPDQISIQYRKATSDDLHEDISNFDALCDAAMAAGFERFL